MIVYVETSAILKPFLEEPGRDAVLRLWTEATVLMSSVLTYPEARAALVAAARDRRLTRAHHQRAVSELELWWSEVNPVTVGRPIAAAAGLDAESFALKGCDAVHLATARLAGPAGIVFATFDRRLAEAARSAGLAVSPPLN